MLTCIYRAVLFFFKFTNIRIHYTWNKHIIGNLFLRCRQEPQTPLYPSLFQTHLCIRYQVPAEMMPYNTSVRSTLIWVPLSIGFSALASYSGFAFHFCNWLQLSHHKPEVYWFAVNQLVRYLISKALWVSAEPVQARPFNSWHINWDVLQVFPHSIRFTKKCCDTSWKPPTPTPSKRSYLLNVLFART